MRTRHCSVRMVYAAVRGGALDWIDMERSTVAELRRFISALGCDKGTRIYLALKRLGRELWALSWRRGRPNRASSEITRELRGDVQRLATSNHRQIRPPRFCGGFAEVHAKAENPLTPDVVVQHNSNPQRLLHHHSQPFLAHALPLTLQGPRGTPPPFHAIIHRDLDSTWAILGLDGPS